MANTITNLIPDAYAALDVVGRELVGFIPSVTRDSGVDQVAKGQSVRVAQTPVNTAGRDISPAMSLPAKSDQTIGSVSVAIDRYRAFPFSWEEESGNAVNQGPGILTVQQGQIAQALRAAVKEIEIALGVAAYKGASRAISPTDTSLFKSGFADAAQLRKVLDDNAAPASDRHLVIDTTSGASLRSLTQVTNVNESGSDAGRRGELLNVHGFSIKESVGVQTPAIGTGATVSVATGGYSVGATTLTLKAAGTGTIEVGDVVSITGDSDNKYVVTVGAAAVSGAEIQIAAPGLRQAITGEKVLTIYKSSSRNVGFDRSAIILASRLPVSAAGDQAEEREVITDPVSGLSFEIARYPGYRMNVFEVAIAYGVKVLKTENIAILAG